MGWVERFGDLCFSHALPSPPQIISKPHNPIKSQFVRLEETLTEIGAKTLPLHGDCLNISCALVCL